MANPFETPILTRAYAVRGTLVPQLADADFWSPVLQSRRDYAPIPPGVDYLVTDTGDFFIDNFNNELVAAI